MSAEPVALKEVEADVTAPVDPLPPVRIRRWPRFAGLAWWVWTLVEACVLTSTFAVFTLTFMWVVRPLARVMPIVWSRLLLFLAGVKVETTFEAPLPDGPVIFVMNHQSNFDILSLFVALGPVRPFVFVAKKSVFSYPFLGWFITAAKYIPIDRANREKSIRSLESAGEKIRAGTSVLVFAEGTRSTDGSILPFKKGAFMVAMKAKVPLVPVAIEGGLRVNPKRRWYVCPNTMRLLVGPARPMHDAKDEDRDAIIKDVRGAVIRLHRRLGGLGGDPEKAIAAAGLDGIAASDRPGQLS